MVIAFLIVIVRWTRFLRIGCRSRNFFILMLRNSPCLWVHRTRPYCIELLYSIYTSVPLASFSTRVYHLICLGGYCIAFFFNLAPSAYIRMFFFTIASFMYVCSFYVHIIKFVVLFEKLTRTYTLVGSNLILMQNLVILLKNILILISK